MKEIKSDIMFLDWKNQYYEYDYTTQSNLQIQYNLYQIINGTFHSPWTKNFTICTEKKKTLNSLSNLEKEKVIWRNKAPWLHTMLQINQDSMVPAQKQKSRSMEQDKKPRDKPMHLIYDKGGKNIQWRKITSSISGAGKTGQLYVKE